MTATIFFRFRILVVGKVRADRCAVSSRLNKSYFQNRGPPANHRLLNLSSEWICGCVAKTPFVHLSSQLYLLTPFGKDLPMNTPSMTADIDSGWVPSDSRHLIVHEYSSFESGDVQNISIVRDFIIRHSGANCPASERLHIIW